MALRIVSWRGNEARVSQPPPVSSASAVSVVAIDSISSPQNQPTMSQTAPEAPEPRTAGLEAEPGTISGISAGAEPTTDDSFLRHDTYFFKDGNITFMVDGTLYCVHRYFFSRDSAYFSTKFFQLGVRDHETLRTIVSLGDIERRDFEALLSVMYPENFDEHDLSYEQWRSVLHLSTRWGFSSLRRLALRSVKPPTPCDQLLLARTYGIDHWVLPALSALCERTTPLSLKEARQMNIEDVVLVATVREDICHRGSRAEIPLRIETVEAMIAHAADDEICPTGSKNGAAKNGAAEKEPDSTEVVTADPGPEGNSDDSSKTAATTTAEDDKREDDEHLAGAAVISLGENNQQDVEQQTQEATSKNSPGDVEEPSSELGDGSSEKGLKKTETTLETENDFGSDKVKVETTSSEAAQVADTLTEEPETQEQAERSGRADEAAKDPAPAKPQAVVEPQPPARATPLYWRRLTSRYMSMPPPPS
ncbi:hypothetical protein BJV74DRAFT_43321 [Russula compacta]|nr:hypothetical protein BJV74DRAFT_43321 [Russula compacta]